MPQADACEGKGRPPAHGDRRRQGPSSAIPSADGGPRAEITAKTLRTDRWWLQPLITASSSSPSSSTPPGRRSTTTNFYAAPYLSPFYSPCFADGCPSAIAWGHVDIWHWLSPALYILIFPLSFRATCYYYRKAYYRSYWLSPPACAVAEPHKKYSGETRFPLIIQNIHRYTWYFAVIFAGILSYDAVVPSIYRRGTTSSSASARSSW